MNTSFENQLALDLAELKIMTAEAHAISVSVDVNNAEEIKETFKPVYRKLKKMRKEWE